MAKRLTAARIGVLTLINTASVPIAADKIINSLKVNKTTVYRQLHILLEDKQIKELDFGDGKKRYESAKLNHHHHLICSRCGQVADIPLEENWLLKQISQLTDFKITKHMMEFFGYCRKCQN